ncbi:MAG: hypothetical protein HY078_17625 [Elusimicrobia bacterium]|nr:hypothetical protein [Elusimicrobiota bacterium]
MHDLSGWPIDLRAVYLPVRWARRERFHLMERMYESPDGSHGVLFYGIGEVGVNKQVGYAALFEDKAAPLKVWSSRWKTFWFEGSPEEAVTFSADGKTARLLEHLTGPGGRLDWRARTLFVAERRLDRLPGIAGYWERFVETLPYPTGG